ncbi:hypothetical protein [Pseudoalteromonas sp. MMG024]|uniref:hypothetical protein n=1 Tax=Pseudoalteromonas sp. MMG024 TaxID=2909980 RepID=UPI001F27B2DD|nr:hypothetical protein [Pseudoalteromonas sp. MMG024]MCF6459001.1 hypothetical protein [Pseudoalteromonas sp. MMG024]
MMFSKWIKHTVLATTITVFSAASYSLIAKSNTTSHGCNCPPKLQVASTGYFPTGSCQARAANQSWFSWFIGKSRSSQFHYLDLLELLESGKKEAQANYSTHIR